MFNVHPEYAQNLWRNGQYEDLSKFLSPLRNKASLFRSFWAECRLALGDWRREVWQGYEARFASCIENDRQSMTAVAKFDKLYTPWTGQELEGKRLLIIGDGGFGDTILCLRYIPKLEALGAEVVWRVLPGLGSFTGREELHEPMPKADYWFPMMSLTGIFDTQLTTIPKQWKPAIQWQADGQETVTYCLTGNSRHPHDRDRSIHRQPDLPGSWTVAPQSNRTFLETALYLLQCRALVTVDTSMMHLGGSLGIPTYCLTAKGHDWRLLNELKGGLVRRSVWYDSVTIVEQSRRGDWSTPIEYVVSTLS